MNELKAIAEINEKIKSIGYTAENISLIATNAMLVARQAGINAVGFSVVAHELRMFSEKMAIAMKGLGGLIYQQVIATARKRHKVRNMGLLDKAGTYGELAQSRIAPACARSQADVDESSKLIASLLCGLRITMRRTGKQCATGLVIARSAHIEAAHGGVMTPVLRQIAQGVEDAVGKLVMRVSELEYD
ncbi:hypothetical protein [Methylobacter sp.]|uniref:hypothetical protein n=1 Tax=Methylobacter sp. TaxID=2051955 RepID=UPI00248A8373|nr:hypothetical protein [Methylobacter sp.]MDI1276169.1 hypothetical protein [Methylobacter sp.]MDI1356943.1 hypothetical protein [Methylobacter sp.]